MKLSTRLRKLRKTQRLKLRPTDALLIVLGFTVAGFLYASTVHTSNVGRLVTFHDRGEEHVILTHATSVQDALKDANISVAPQDVVEPALGSELLDSDSAVIIYRARPVLVVDGAIRQKVTTSAQSPTEIATLAGISPLQTVDKTAFTRGDFIADGASTILTIKRTVVTPNTVPTLAAPKPNTLTKSRGAQLYTDVDGVTHRETYYDLPMNIVINACGPGGYTIRGDGAKIDKDGYVLVAASYRAYPRCSIVDTSMGAGKVYDTGGFALRYPYGFDLATDWTNYDGR